jgi:phosphatidate phosphatase LPIN
MKLGEGGEAFFVFETTEEIPASMQTSPLVSPAASPKIQSEENLAPSLQEPEYLDLDQSKGAVHPPLVSRGARATSDLGTVTLPSRLHLLLY